MRLRAIGGIRFGLSQQRCKWGFKGRLGLAVMVALGNGCWIGRQQWGGAIEEGTTRSDGRQMQQHGADDWQWRQAAGNEEEGRKMAVEKEVGCEGGKGEKGAGRGGWAAVVVGRRERGYNSSGGRWLMGD
ncbi:hypothetical protein GW17_00044051 [Ensete ventricosum]|nr:hypothetical protein GW17_00044051 [Ensete ventricosum]RZS06128.1 hypothetical protein BHM03_00036729 [Ensete ventricosum]